MKLASRLAQVNRYLLALSAGYLFAVLILVGLAALRFDDVFADGWLLAFFQGLLTSVVFFGLVGLVAVFQSVSAARGDILRKRVEYLFATRGVSVTPHLVHYVESLVKRNGLYSSLTENLVEIIDYSKEIDCYRVHMTKSFELHNVFGDLKQRELYKLTFAPDLVDQTVAPLAELVRLDIDGESVLNVPRPIAAIGLEHEFIVELEPGEVSAITHEHWTWASNVGNSGFGLRRFSERTRVVVRNNTALTTRVFRPEQRAEVFPKSPDEDGVIDLPPRSGSGTLRQDGRARRPPARLLLATSEGAC